MGVPRLWRWLTGAHKQCVRFAADAADLATWLEEHSGLDAPASMDALAIDLNATIHNANINPDGGIAACDPLTCSEELFNQVFGLVPKQLEAALQLRADPDCMEDLKREFAQMTPPEALALSDLVNAALDSAGCPRGDARLRIFLRGALLRLAAIIWTMAPGKALFVALDGPAPAAKFTQQRERRYRSSHGMFTAASSGGATSVLATEGFGPIDTVQGAAATSSQLYDPSAISPGTALMRFVDSSVRHLLEAMATAPAMATPGAASGAGSGEGVTAGLGDHAMASTRPPRVVGAPATAERRFVAKGAIVVFSGAGDAGEGEHKLMALLRSWLAGGAAAAAKEALRWQGSDSRTSGCWGRAVGDESGLFWWEGSAGQSAEATAAAGSAAPRGATVTFWGPDGDALVLGLSLLGRFGAAAPMAATEGGAAVGAAAVPPLREVVIARDYDKAFRREWRSQMKADRRAAGGGDEAEGDDSESNSESSDAGSRGRRRGGKGRGSKRKGGASQRRRSSAAEAAAEARAAGLAPMPGAGADWDSPKPARDAAASAAEATARADGTAEPSGRILSRTGQRWLSDKGRRVRRPLGSFVSCRQLAEHLFDDAGSAKRGGKHRKGRHGGHGAHGGHGGHGGGSADSHRAGPAHETASLPPAPAPRAEGTPSWALSSRQSHRCIDLVPVMCAMGNDFLPRPEALDLDSRGMAGLLAAYREAEEEMARASRGAPLGDYANVPAGASALPWRPLVACMTDDPSDPAQPGVVVGLRFLARFLWRAASDAERADLSSALDGIARMSDSDDGAPLALPTSGVVGASGAMGALKQRSVSSAASAHSSGPASDPASLTLLRRIRSSWTADGGAVRGGLDEEDLGGSARGDWYASHMSGCGPMRHVREVASGAGGDAASGEQGEGPWPSDMAGAAARPASESQAETQAEAEAEAEAAAAVAAAAAGEGDAAGSAARRPARRLTEASVEDTLAVACEAWVAGLGFTCAYYLTGLPSWHFRYPFAHAPMLSDVGCWAACAGGRAAGAPMPELGLVDARIEDGEASLAVALGAPLCAAAHCASVITPYSLHLLPPTLRSAMGGLLPWAPVTSPGALLPVRPAKGGAASPPGAAADAAAHPFPPLEAVPPALLAAVGSSSSLQAWWFPAWEDVRQDSEKAMADWQVKLWIPLAGVGWAERVGRAWEAAVAGQDESDAFKLPTGANVITAT